MSKEIRSVLGDSLRCYLVGADVLEVMSLYTYSGHNSTTGSGQRCQSEMMSVLSVLLREQFYLYVYIYLFISVYLLETQET